MLRTPKKYFCGFAPPLFLPVWHQWSCIRYLLWGFSFFFLVCYMISAGNKYSRQRLSYCTRKSWQTSMTQSGYQANKTEQRVDWESNTLPAPLTGRRRRLRSRRVQQIVGFALAPGAFLKTFLLFELLHHLQLLDMFKPYPLNLLTLLLFQAPEVFIQDVVVII